MIKYKLANEGKSFVKYLNDTQVSSGLVSNDEFKRWIADGNIPDPEFTQEELDEQEAEARRAEIIDRLNQIDAESVRPLRAVLSDTATQTDTDKLAALAAEAEILRGELK